MELKDLKIVTIFAYLLIGVILIGVIANMVEENTEGKTEVNEQINISTLLDDNGDFNSSLLIALANNEILSITSYTNSSGTTVGTLNTDYLINNTLGQVFILNTTTTHPATTDGTLFGDNMTNMTYVYQMDNYVEDGTSRTIITLIVIFFAIGVLAIGMQALGLFDWKQF